MLSLSEMEAAVAGIAALIGLGMFCATVLRWSVRLVLRCLGIDKPVRDAVDVACNCRAKQG